MLLRSTFTTMHVRRPEDFHAGIAQVEAGEEWLAAWADMEKKIPAAREVLAEELRRLLDPRADNYSSKCDESTISCCLSVRSGERRWDGVEFVAVAKVPSEASCLMRIACVCSRECLKGGPASAALRSRI